MLQDITNTDTIELITALHPNRKCEVVFLSHKKEFLKNTILPVPYDTFPPVRKIPTNTNTRLFALMEFSIWPTYVRYVRTYFM